MGRDFDDWKKPLSQSQRVRQYQIEYEELLHMFHSKTIGNCEKNSVISKESLKTINGRIEEGGNEDSSNEEN